MLKINKLESSIYNRISAGEVVERPASVVKELVENSIDAGAVNISVSVTGGGIKNITVTDDGSGISSEYVKTAFLPHATSKIGSVEDLDDISTLGFRGEALASVASVSLIDMKTRAEDEETGIRICLSGGETTLFETWGGNSGTSISVSELFFNTPARAKFLKSERSEQAEISELMREMILSNPEISFSYQAENKTVYESFGQGLIDALYNVYPKDFCRNLIPVDKSVGNYRVFGYCGNAQLSKANRNYQTLIVNGRIVKDSNVGIAAMQAFGNRLMKRSFPVFVLNLLVPFEELDVNVHPSKTEVRFRDNRRIFSLVYSAIKEALEESESFFVSESSEETSIGSESCREPFLAAQEKNALSQCDEIGVATDKIASSVLDDSVSDGILQVKKTNVDNAYRPKTEFIVADSSQALMMPFEKSENSIIKKSDKAVNKTDYLKNNYENDSNSEQFSFYDVELNSVSEQVFVNNLTNKTIKNSFSKNENEFDIEKIVILGQVFLTYVLLSDDEYFYVIDQHAAQERVFYDKLIAACDKKAVEKQFLLIPVVETFTHKEYDFLIGQKGLFADFGFDIEEFGDNAIRIFSVPAIFANADLRGLFGKFLSEQNLNGNLEFGALKDKFAKTACKAAIKFGDKLSVDDIKGLLRAMNEDGMPLQCPHGRPTVIKLVKKDFDKMFKRIL